MPPHASVQVHVNVSLNTCHVHATCHAHATCTHACYIHAQEQREWQHARQSAALLQQGAATTSKSSKLLGVGVGATAGEAGALRLEVRTNKLAVVELTLTPILTPILTQP